MQNDISILSAGDLEPSLVEEAKSKGVSIDVLPFIDTEMDESIAVQQEVENFGSQQITAIFTSRQAVEAVATHLHDCIPVWNIYCTAGETLELISERLGSCTIKGTGKSAAEIAQKIIVDYNGEEMVFFCGDKRRKELPDLLNEHNIDLVEVIVYHTIPVTHKLDKDFLGIMFYSPSAVKSFFSSNKTGKKTVFFAIGNTTANEIRNLTGNKIITAGEPSKRFMFNQVMEYFT